MTRGALALVCLTAGKTLSELCDDDFAAFARALAGAPTAGRDAWMHNSARVFSLHQACYELRICQHPPRQARPGQASIAQRVQAISQPGIRAAALRYLTTVAATLRPNTVGLRADSLIVFSEYLAATVMPWAAEALAQYIDQVRPCYEAGGHPALWLTERGGPISPRQIDDRFAAWRAAAGLPGELSVHCLRHSFRT